MLHKMLRNFRYGLRALVKAPGFTIVAVLTLALGIGANTAIFSIVNAALLMPVSIPDPGRVVMVWTDNPGRNARGLPASFPDYQDWKNQSGAFSSLGAFQDDGFNLGNGDRVEHLDGLYADVGLFEVFRARPFLGRVFEPDDIRPGHDGVAVLSYALWISSFGADRDVVGKVVDLDGRPCAVVGVLPKDFPKFGEEKIYRPFVPSAQQAHDRGTRFFGVVGRLKPGVSFAGAQSRMTALNDRLAKEYPADEVGDTVRLQPVEEFFVQDVRALLLILFGVVGFVLLIACANVANLLLARGTARSKEMAVRAALGASRSDLAAQMMTESLLLSVVGGALGIIPAAWGIAFISACGLDLPNADLLKLNSRVLIFALLVSLATGLLFGLVPSLRAWKTGLNEVLKSSGSSGGGPARQRLRGVFVAGQIALTLVLLVGAGLMMRSFIRMKQSSPGFQAQGAVSFTISLSQRQYSAPEQQAAYFSQALDRAAAIPGVQIAGATDALPTSDTYHGSGLHLLDRPEPAPKDLPIVLTDVATPDYFRAMQIPLLRGRYFQEADRKNSPLVAIVDEWSAKRYWPNQDPIGKELKLSKSGAAMQVVGVVGNVDRGILAKFVTDVGQVYTPFAQDPKPLMMIVVRSTRDPADLIPSVRKAIADLDSSQPIFQVKSLDAARDGQQVPQRLATLLLGGFAALALLLATIGIYGVVSYAVGQRTREIGIRLAIGAQSGDVLRMVLRQGFVLTVFGIAIGMAGAALLTRVLAGLLYGVRPMDPVTFASGVALLAGTSFLATLIPARRAMRVDPIVALRYE